MSMPNLAQEAQFSVFRSTDFDAAQFTSHALSGAVSSAQTTGHQLRENIKQLEDDIRSEVVLKQQQLHEVVDGMKRIEGSCTSVQSTIHHLAGAVGDMETSIEGPCRRLEQRTNKLKNLRSAIETLRVISRQLKVVEKIKKRIGDTDGDLDAVDVPDVAQLIAEFQSLGIETDVAEIEVLEDAAKLIRALVKNVRSWAEVKLFKGLESMNQVDMGVALHSYFNLKELVPAVEAAVSKKCARFSQRGRSAFDFHKLIGGGKATGQHPLQENVWLSVQSLMADLEEDFLSIFHLQQVLRKKQDPVSQMSLFDAVSIGEDLIDRFWNQAVAVFERNITHVVQPGKSTPVREVLVHDFPKLCSILETSLEQLSHRVSVKGQTSCLGPRHLQSLLGSCQSMQNVFSTRSLAHMTDVVNAVFPSNSRAVPSITEIQKLVSVFHEEMKKAESSVHTCRIVANNIANAILSLTERVGMLSSSVSDLRSLTGSCTASQLRNIMLCSNLQEIHRSFASLISRLENRGTEFLIPACDALRSTAIGLIAPIVKSLAENLEKTLLEMHSLSSWNAEASPTVEYQPSGFVTSVRVQLRTFSMEFLTRFIPPFSPSTPSFVRSLVKRLACRLIVFFTRHAALIRPLSQAGRRQLIADTSEMELVISQTLGPVSLLSSQATTLQAFKELLESDPENIRNNAAVMQLPRSIILYHLFTRAPKELVLPHELTQLSPAQFSFWLDNHSLEEAVIGVQSVLDKPPASPECQKIIPILLDLCNMSE